MAIRAECGHYCASCQDEIQDRQPGRQSDISDFSLPTARAPLDDRAAVEALDEIGDEEIWLWRLVDEADRVIAAAPTAPAQEHIDEVERRFSTACQAEEKIQIRIKATEAALARPSSWLRPAHRCALVSHMDEDRAAAVVAAVHRGRIEDLRNRMRAVSAAHASYVAQHRAILSAGQNARAELDRIFDDLIDGYARLNEPPAWFRFGLGFPPPPGAQREWLSQARETLAQRRRLALGDPNW